ncbi:TPA: glycosyltransferase, partial [Escherichia coli]|nr:glycosyltransferase [Escherichia coli]
NIAIVIYDAYGYAGTENVANFMSECFSTKHKVTVFSLEGSGKTFYPFHNVINIISLSGFRFKMFRLMSLMKKEKYDAVFVISMGKLSVLYSLYSFLTGLTSRSIACEHIALSSFPKPIKFLKFIFLRRFERVVVLTKTDEIKYINHKIRAVHIPNPLNYNHFMRNSRSNIYLAVGRLEQQKGFDRLLKIWCTFYKNNESAKLFIAGEGSQKDKLHCLCKELQISQSVIFLGKVDNIDRYYKKADVLLMTSYYEGMPLVLLEAKSWSLPVIAYDCPTGPREIIANNIDGFLIPDNDHELFISKMIELTSNDTLYYEFCKNTAITSRSFNANAACQKWNNLIE